MSDEQWATNDNNNGDRREKERKEKKNNLKCFSDGKNIALHYMASIVLKS